MKNIFRIVMAVAILFTASCAKEDISSSIGGGEVEVTFTADLGQLGTRAYGEAKNVDRVYLGVYEAGEKTPLDLVNYKEGYPVSNGKASITVVLLKDKKYDLVFWAQNNAQTCYARNWDDRSITVDYTGVKSQNDLRDAFFLVENDFWAGHDETVFELRRPFAQLRAAISKKDQDYITKNGSEILTSKVEVKGVANIIELNTENAEVYGDQTVTFDVADIPADGDKFIEVNGVKYQQLSMNYILVREKKLVDVTYTFADDNTNYTRPYYNVPIQRNYRTNILGQLISSPMDFTVIIKPEFEGEHTVEVWDGESVSEPAYDATTQTYSIVKPSELAWIAKTVNAGVTRVTENDNMRGKTIKLTSDIDLGGHEWLPIGYITGPAKGDYEGYPIAFKGTFDGQGHTVKGLYVRENKYAGLFGCLCGATIKNVNIVGAELISNHYAGAIAAWNENVKTVIENCNVSNAVITLTAEPVADGWDNGDKAGAIIGFLHGGKVNGCSAKDVTVTAYRDFGGIVGYAQSNATVSNNSVLENVKLIVDNSHNYKNYTKFDEYSVNSIVGDPVSVTLEGNTGEAAIRMVIADGVTMDKAGVYYISSAEGLKWVEAQEDNYFAGKTIELANDIDMAGVAIEKPIKFWGGRTTFDGKNHTISNLTMSTTSTEKNPFSLFGGTADIKNVKFDNANISGYSYVAVVAGNLYGNIENCHVANSTVTCTYWMAGAMSGQYNAGNVTNCSVKNTTVTGPAAVGALIGNINETAGERKVENCLVEDCTVAQNSSFGGNYDLMFASAVGLINIDNSTVYFNDVTVTNTTVKGVASDALFGEAEDSTTILINGVKVVADTASLSEALNNGDSVVLNSDIDFGTTQLTITGENQVVDLGGHALTTANNWGGISLKNGAVIKNGTITHSGNTAAIKAFNGCSVENVVINATCATADKTVTGIAVQQGANVESIKNVTINGVSQGIEVGYQATVGLIENAVVNESNNGTAKGIGLVINGGKVGKAKDCTFKGETYGITLHLKGVFAAGLELENCAVEGATASIYAWDEKGISNTSGSLVLTYDAATTLTGELVWDFEDECKSVVTLNRPE